MLQQMFEVASTRFHEATQTFSPLIDNDSVVDRCCWNSWKLRRLPGNAREVPIDLHKLEKKVKKIILRRDITKTCHARDMMQD